MARRFLTVKVFLAGLVCLAAISNGHPDPHAREQRVAARRRHRLMARRAMLGGSEPVAVPEPVLEVTTPPEETSLQTMAEPPPTTTTEEQAPVEEQKPVVDEKTTTEQGPAPVDETSVDAKAAEDAAGTEGTTDPAVEPVDPAAEKPEVDGSADPEASTTDPAEVPAEEPVDKAAVEGEPAPTEGGEVQTMAGETATPQGQMNPEDIGNVLGKTDLGGLLDEAEFETVDATTGQVLDSAASAGNTLSNANVPSVPSAGNGEVIDKVADAVASNLEGKTTSSGGVLDNLDNVASGLGGKLGGADAGASSSTTKDTTATSTGSPAAAAAATGAETDKQAAGAPADAEQHHLYITSFQCDVDNVYAAEQDQIVTCTVEAESSAGVASISAAFYNAAMTKRVVMYFGEEEQEEGDANKGSWTAELTIPKAADQGVWNLGFSDQGAFYGLEIIDALGNIVNYAQAEAEATILPLQQHLTVQSYTGNTAAYPQANIEASSGIKLYGLSCDLPSVTVTAQAAEVPCSALVVPDEADGGKVLAYLVSPTGKTVLPLTFAFDDTTADKVLVPATNTTEAMWHLSARLQVPTAVESGAYTLAEGGAFQTRTLSGAGTLRLVSPASLARKPQLTVVAANDKAAPRLSNFYCNQGREVKLANDEAVPINCLLRASDDLAGVSYASMHFVSPSRQEAVEFAFVPPSPGLGPFANVPVTQVAETVNVELPPATEPGAWTLARAVVADNSGNYHEYRATELDQLNVQTFFLVQSPARTFAIAPKPGSGAEVQTPGQATSAAPAGTRPSGLLLAATAAAGAILGVAAYLF